MRRVCRLLLFSFFAFLYPPMHACARQRLFTLSRPVLGLSLWPTTVRWLVCSAGGAESRAPAHGGRGKRSSPLCGRTRFTAEPCSGSRTSPSLLSGKVLAVHALMKWDHRTTSPVLPRPAHPEPVQLRYDTKLMFVDDAGHLGGWRHARRRHKEGGCEAESCPASVDGEPRPLTSTGNFMQSGATRGREATSSLMPGDAACVLACWECVATECQLRGREG